MHIEYEISVLDSELKVSSRNGALPEMFDLSPGSEINLEGEQAISFMEDKLTNEFDTDDFCDLIDMLTEFDYRKSKSDNPDELYQHAKLKIKYVN